MMKKLKKSLYIVIFLLTNVLPQIETEAQPNLIGKIASEERALNELREKEKVLLKNLEGLKLQKIQYDIKEFGLPAFKENEIIVHHDAMSLSYDEEHEQARWVVHIITPDIIEGNLSRTNDFRKDSLIKTGTAVKADYWYSGFDRGHLAPSADFRWSRKAMSQSYYYSNMSPQRPELNRERWGELEAKIRDYVAEKNEQVFIVSGGILKQGLPTIGKNKVSIPELFYKIVLDIEGEEKHGIAFVMPNGKCEYPVFSYAVSIDSVERLTGIDFFHALPDSLEQEVEKELNIDAWRTAADKGEAIPLDPTTLPRNTFNTVQAKQYVNKNEKIVVCGTVVSTKFSERSGATFINLDKKFPNQIFSITIWKDNQKNFSYLPHEVFKGKKICVEGVVRDYKGTPTMDISSEEAVQFMEEVMFE